MQTQKSCINLHKSVVGIHDWIREIYKWRTLVYYNWIAELNYWYVHIHNSELWISIIWILGLHDSSNYGFPWFRIYENIWVSWVSVIKNVLQILNIEWRRDLHVSCNKINVNGIKVWLWIPNSNYGKPYPRQQSSWGQHEAHLGPVGPRWAPWTLLSCRDYIMAGRTYAVVKEACNHSNGD